MKYLKYLLNYSLSLVYDILFFFFGDMKSRVQGFGYYKESKAYPLYLKRGNMVEAILPMAHYFCKGNGLDIGSGQWPLKNARAIENDEQENANKINEENETQDFVFSSHLLEHIKDWQGALVEWNRVLKPGGIIFLYLPHPSCHMWQPGVNDQHLWPPNAEKLSKYLTGELNMQIEYKTSLPDGYLSFVIITKKNYE